ncbi:MAG TPA: metallophosphoesterase [Nocardioidaceae bacterium]|nr:metallophosphoesterase [Nocardioidaceae bacterium]
MRILLVSDLHYRLRQYDWLYDTAPEYDVVVIAGDLLSLRSPVPAPAQFAAVSALISRIAGRQRLLVASGNHDVTHRDPYGEKAAIWLTRTEADGLFVDGASLMVDGTLFTVCPWWDGDRGRQALDERLAVDAAVPKDRWIWVYHAPPSGSPLSFDGRREYGDEVVLEWINRFTPDFVLCGHIHQSPWVEGGGWVDRVGSTWVFNAGHEPADRPSHIVLDLEASTATWTSSEGRETRDL